jgi:UDP-2-acetamido-3-amino-2,3-dideoxy-glucuronate N-acetyltransferase
MVAVAVVGAGYWGKNLVRNFSNLECLNVICDAQDDVRQATQLLYPDITCYDNLEDVLGDKTIDAVVIATPAVTHGMIARKALEARKHVFVEKPICLNLAEARELASYAEENGLTLMVGHMLLYHPAFIAMQDVVRQGQLGKLRYIYSTRLSLGKIRNEENALWSFAPHDVSMILALTGRMPESVICNGEAYLADGVADTTLSHMTFSDKLQAHIFVSWLHPFKDQRLVVVGEDGMVVFNDVAQGAEKLLFYPHQVGWEDGIPNIQKAEAVPVSYAATEPLREECQHFIDCIEQGKIPKSNAEEAIQVLSVLDACQRSLQEKILINPKVI